MVMKLHVQKKMQCRLVKKYLGIIHLKRIKIQVKQKIMTFLVLQFQNLKIHSFVQNQIISILAIFLISFKFVFQIQTKMF